jgi:valyl-tRNA synthetase
MSEIPKQYDPQAAQAKWFPMWEHRGYFNADPPRVRSGDSQPKPPHTIMIPLPNVTGALHMGHALNGTLQDLITRWRRMQGFAALWMPGTDHAGIATQAVVERRMLEEEGLTRHDVGREALVKRIWRWKDTYEKRIVGQQKSLGASCDWRRIRFTLDDVCAKAVRHTFFKMFRDGLIYRGKRLVNWDTFLQTAVADDEVFEEDVAGHFWTFHYPVVDASGNDTGEVIRFSTTRPETMLGDTAVCVNPTDERYTHLVGKHVRIPLNGRVIPIIADGLLADKELGTGAVKVTPAHDPNDYACYQRNPHIGVINILNPNGTLNDACANPKYAGLDRYKARELAVEDMANLGCFDAVEDRTIPLKHSDRSKTPVEPYLSDQWFVKMGPHTTPDGRTIDLAQSAIDAVQEQRVRFYPSRYASTYLDWLGEKRDWCISRQLWWGHRIPIWSKEFSLGSNPGSETSKQILELGFIVGDQVSGTSVHGSTSVQGVSFDGDTFGIGSLTVNGRELSGVAYSIADSVPGVSRHLLVCVDEGSAEVERKFEAAGFTQDPDVLDTWFSSALWPHATLGWPDVDHDPPLDPNVVANQDELDDDFDADDVDTPEAQGLQPLGFGGNRALAYFYPHATPADGNQSVLITSRDIITLWVARMVLTGLYNMGEIPFRHVHVHPKILDGFGQTMSKSKGNGVDPVDLIEKYGADAVRFTIASFAGETQDVRLPVGYACPSCDNIIPQTQKHQTAKPEGGPKPTIKCPKCKAEFQYTTPNYDPDPGVPVARMVSERFEYGRNFCNKFWNAARFAIMNLQAGPGGAAYSSAPVTADQLALEDRWILSRLSTVAQQVDEYLSRYQFDAATRTLRDFTWNEFCDWYLEMIKPRLRGAKEDSGTRIQESGSTTSNENRLSAPQRGEDADEVRAVAQRVLLGVLDSLLRLLQPFTPFLCEELWQRLKELGPERAVPAADSSPDSRILNPESSSAAAIIAPWPRIPRGWQDSALEKRFERLQDTIIAVRNVRAIYNLPPGTPVKLLMRATPDVAADVQSVAAQFDNLAKAVLEAAGAEVQRPTGAASFSLGDADGYIPLAGLINTDAELERQTKEADKLRKLIAGSEAKLSNAGFLAKAPENVVAQHRETLENMQKQLASIEAIIQDLS